ncbi:hypothetical protein EDD16DRAFT_1777512 [Pisolithus croceorrhizus]|nr:hypothetical protein EDD16DRAFT_1777512 [Pisolithus croceorrhizus]KAI6165991.1 hypothetical protein EDD17DRAFT_1505469 [Pisolithus thermaeus]
MAEHKRHNGSDTISSPPFRWRKNTVEFTGESVGYGRTRWLKPKVSREPRRRIIRNAVKEDLGSGAGLARPSPLHRVRHISCSDPILSHAIEQIVDGGERCGGGEGGGSPVAASTTFPSLSGYGRSGRPISVSSNFFNVTPPKEDSHHYDAILLIDDSFSCAIEISFKMSPPARHRMDLINQLMAPVQKLLSKFNVSLPGDVNRGYGQRVYKIRLTKVAAIIPETVTTALTVLNVVIRMEPNTRYPFSSRSFFTDREVRDIGSSIVLWRRYLRSVWPAIGRLLVKIDTPARAMYKGGLMPRLSRKTRTVVVPKPTKGPVRERKDQATEVDCWLTGNSKVHWTAHTKPLTYPDNICVRVFAYEQSPYVLSFSMHVDGTAGPINLLSRILPPSKLRIDKRFFRHATTHRWIVVVYECQQRFNQQFTQDMIASECYRKTQQKPSLVVVVLPGKASDTHTSVKHFGDTTIGVATQCANEDERCTSIYMALLLFAVSLFTYKNLGTDAWGNNEFKTLGMNGGYTRYVLLQLFWLS